MRIVRLILQLAIFVLLILGAITLWESFRTGSWLPGWLGGENKTETLHTVVLEEITALGKLELVRYNFKDVVEQEVVKQWLPNAKAVLIVQGEAIGCVDLTQMRLADITSESQMLVVHLPEPELCVFKIDHERSKVYNTEYAFLEEAQLVQEGYRQAERQIRQSALEMGILEQTEENARKMLTPMLEKISGRKVLVKFPMTARLPKLR
ncbi:hypothetical protein GCM10027275_23420 [Rhabdobacter roseus]|uniref:DUF4230 domain-containing protein n=1 Tax=Rhabdobacter roseus TaxID=1655419 RepID=A0A840TRU7_9BACT|nr:DUF4230 domain-containing protein [Rhabdobacter roseus]MBB5284282.1 hypothetical protein [Rhabdobacter roseus]